MAIYGAFTSSMMSMMSQSSALDTIGKNIANVNTGGYKRTDTRFSTVLSDTINTTSDLGGVRPKHTQLIDTQGNIKSTSRAMDAAISGKGFFVLNTERNGSGETYFTRDGSFQTVPGDPITVPNDDGTGTIQSREAYLVDKNGHYVMGWQPQDDGTFNTSGQMSAMRVDSYAFRDEGVATTQNRLSMNLPSGADTGQQHQYNIRVYDDAGNARTITLNFEKQANLREWSVTPQWEGQPQAQVDTLTMGGTVEAGDVYSATVNGTTVSYTVTGSEANMTAVRNNLLSQIRNNSAIASDVTATASGTNAITLTANTAGTGFTSDINATQGPSDTAQVDTIELTGAVEAGDSYTVTVDNNSLTYTVTGAEADMAEVRDNLRAAINADATLSGLVTASDSGTQDLTLTAASAGTSFSGNVTYVDNGGTANAATISTTTANYTAQTNNTASQTTTTQNNDGTYTGTATTMRFDSEAQLISPTTLSMNITWNDGSVSTDLDMSEVTQYAGEFTPHSYWQNGYGSGQLREFSFGANGDIQGHFSNTQVRSIYRVGLAVFSNPNGLDHVNGNLFKTTADSGDPRIVSAGENSYGTINGHALENSNVDIADEFTNMIVTQQAYNSSATVFRTVDEMTTVARDLKS